MRKSLYLFFILPTFLFAQPNQDWYTNNDRGNHFEGSYTRKVSNPSINLVSLTGNLAAYQFGKKQKLKVRFFSPDNLIYNLHAEELRVSQFYWLEDKNQKAIDGWNEFNNWHVDYILKRFSIDYRNLGLLIQLGEKGVRNYLPAFIQLEEESISPKLYIAQIRLGRPASGGSFSIFEGDSRSEKNKLKDQVISKKSSGTIFPIVIPIEELKGKEGWFTVEINMKEERTGDPFTYSFSFYHQPKL